MIDPRVERSRQVILQATLDELGDHGYGGLTIEGVAARAGVGKATVYRHWDGKLALVEAALEQLKADVVPILEGSPRERVVQLFRGLAGYVSESQFAKCIPAIIDAAERDPAVRAFHHRFTTARRAQSLQLIQEAQAAGEIEPEVDAEAAVDAIAGAIFLRRLFTPSCMSGDEVDALLALVLRWD